MMKKYLLLAAFFVMSVAVGLSAEALPNKTYDAGCKLPLDLKTAVVMDLNQDGHYETMQTIWCDLVNGIEFPITSPIIYPIEGSQGTPINDVAEDPMPWKKLRKQPKLVEFTLEFYVSEIDPLVLYDYQMIPGDNSVYYHQYVPYSDVKELSDNGITISPNPANSIVGMTFSMNSDNNVIIKLYAQNGQLIATLDNNFRTAGDNNVEFNVNDLSSGVYYIQTVIGTQSFVNTLYVVK